MEVAPVLLGALPRLSHNKHWWEKHALTKRMYPDDHGQSRGAGIAEFGLGSIDHPYTPMYYWGYGGDFNGGGGADCGDCGEAAVFVLPIVAATAVVVGAAYVGVNVAATKANKPVNAGAIEFSYLLKDAYAQVIDLAKNPENRDRVLKFSNDMSEAMGTINKENRNLDKKSQRSASQPKVAELFDRLSAYHQEVLKTIDKQSGFSLAPAFEKYAQEASASKSARPRMKDISQEKSTGKKVSYAPHPVDVKPASSSRQQSEFIAGRSNVSDQAQQRIPRTNLGPPPMSQREIQAIARPPIQRLRSPTALPNVTHGSSSFNLDFDAYIVSRLDEDVDTNKTPNSSGAGEFRSRPFTREIPPSTSARERRVKADQVRLSRAAQVPTAPLPNAENNVATGAIPRRKKVMLEP